MIVCCLYNPEYETGHFFWDLMICNLIICEFANILRNCITISFHRKIKWNKKETYKFMLGPNYSKYVASFFGCLWEECLRLPIITWLYCMFKLHWEHEQSCSILSTSLVMVSALKYSTAVPVIFLSALKYHVLPERWTNFYRPLWLLSGVVNSSYSFYWDVTRDWDLRYAKFVLPPYT